MISASKVKTIFVDLDETLLHSQGLNFQWQFFKNALRLLQPHTGSLWQTIKLVHRVRHLDYRKDSHLLNIHKSGVIFGHHTRSDLNKAVQNFGKTAFEIFLAIRQYASPVAGAKEFIDWAVTRHQLVLATNPIWPETVTRLRLEWTGIDASHFHFLTHAENSHYCKPDPRYYQTLLERLSLSPDSCLMIGDSFKKDGPASQVGIPVVILTPPHQTGTELKAIAPLIWSGSFAAIQKQLGG